MGHISCEAPPFWSLDRKLGPQKKNRGTRHLNDSSEEEAGEKHSPEFKFPLIFSAENIAEHALLVLFRAGEGMDEP